VVNTAMLLGDHVLDVMQEFAVSLVKPAILAALFGPFSDQAPGLRHQSLVRSLIKAPTSLEFEDRDKIGSINQSFVLGAFRRIESALVRLLTQRFDPRLHWSIDTKSNQTPRRLSIQAVT
jgi:hypothetical protein